MLSLEEHQVIAGRYRLERALARGGMGSVWIARHLQLDIDVAVKFMARELASSREARARFEREAKASAQIKSPNVVQVHDYGVEDDTPFLVMELLEGEALEARIEREGRLSPADTAAILVPVCRALRRAHEMGLVHRDLKPDNIFLVRGADEVIPKVLDFGIAKLQPLGAAGSSTKTGALLGTPHYMSPEQVRKSSAVDLRSDLWSLGVIAFRCLTGALPFPGDEVGDVLVAICAEPIPRASDLAEDLGPEVDRFFERALSRDLAQRFQSARELAEALGALSGEGFRPSLVMSMGSSQLAAAMPSPATPPAQPAPPPEASTAIPTADEAAASKPAAVAASSTLAAAGPPPAPAVTVDEASPPRDPPKAAVTVDEAPPPRDPPAPAVTLDETAKPPAGDPPSPPAVVPPPVASSRRPGRGILFAIVGLLVAAVGIFAVRAQASRSRPGGAAQPACAQDADCGASAACEGGRCVARLGCATNDECKEQNGGRPSICRREAGVCVALESEDCRVLAGPGDAENGETVWVGAMFPVRAGDRKGVGSQAINAMDLARRDFVSTTGGLLPARPGGPKRPIGIVFCDDGVVANTSRAAQHLVDLRVPAVLGFARSKEVLDLAHSVFVPNGVLMLAANSASSLRDIPRGPGGARLVWRISASANTVVEALSSALAEVVEPELRGAAADKGGAPRGPAVLARAEPLRLTVLRAGNTTGQSYGDAVVSKLRYNGKSVAENGDAFREVVADMGGGDARSRHVAEVVEHRPHVVVVAGASLELIPEIERLWPAKEKHHPRYLVGAPLGHPALLAYAAEHPDLRERLLGVSTVRSTAALTKFVLRYNEVFSAKLTVHDAESAPYDGVYLLAYAAAVVGEGPITGSALAGAFPRLLPSGERIDVGPAGIYRALDALGAGKTIDLEGSSTPLDLDAETGDAAADLAFDCLLAGEKGSAPKATESGLVFRVRTHKLEGVRRCSSPT